MINQDATVLGARERIQPSSVDLEEVWAARLAFKMGSPRLEGVVWPPT